MGQKWTDLKHRDDIMNLFGSTDITSYTISSKQSNLSLDPRHPQITEMGLWVREPHLLQEIMIFTLQPPFGEDRTNPHLSTYLPRERFDCLLEMV